jgi:hypothetical protein
VVSETCGLAILRGSLIGLGLLGLDTALVWFGTTHSLMRLDSFVHVTLPTWLVYKPTPLSDALAVAGTQVIALAFTAFLACLLWRLVHRPWAVVLLSAAVLTGTGIHFTMGAVHPAHWMAVLLFLEYLIVVWAFWRYDLLTMFVVLFTPAFWWLNYTILVMLSPAGAAGEWIAFAVWGLLLLLASGVVFQSNLRRAYRRLSPAF